MKNISGVFLFNERNANPNRLLYKANLNLKKFTSILLFLSLLSTYYAQKINWNTWGETAFKKAKNENKPVFLDVGTEWCTACNLMEEHTYTDTTVIGIINRNFILNCLAKLWAIDLR